MALATLKFCMQLLNPAVKVIIGTQLYSKQTDDLKLSSGRKTIEKMTFVNFQMTKVEIWVD